MQISEEGIIVEQVINLLQLADEDNYIGLSSFEKGINGV